MTIPESISAGLGIPPLAERSRVDLEGHREGAREMLRRQQEAGEQIRKDLESGTGNLAFMVLQLSPAQVRERVGDTVFDEMVTRLAIAVRHPAALAQAQKWLADVEAALAKKE